MKTWQVVVIAALIALALWRTWGWQPFVLRGDITELERRATAQDARIGALYARVDSLQ